MKRSGVSILEVLFAILVVTVGLLGAVAVFPVAGSYVRKARVADASSVIARGAAGDFAVRGMNNAATWREWDGTAFVPATLAPLASYCIDSRFCAANTADWTNASTFPYTHVDNPAGPRMRRVAFFGEQLPATANYQLLADAIFWKNDDLAYLRPGIDDGPFADDRSLPAYGQLDGTDTRRQSDGMYSWMATLVPLVDMPLAANMPPPSPGSTTANSAYSTASEYSLSVVVFHQREAGFAIDDVNERVVAASVPDSTGGQVILTSPIAERLELSPGEWILLSGIKRTTGPLGVLNVPRFGWYQVTDAEEPYDNGTDFECYVSVIGRDWDTSLLFTQATIMEDVATVHEKTVRLVPPNPIPSPPPPFIPPKPWPGT